MPPHHKNTTTSPPVIPVRQAARVSKRRAREEREPIFSSRLEKELSHMDNENKLDDEKNVHISPPIAIQPTIKKVDASTTASIPPSNQKRKSTITAPTIPAKRRKSSSTEPNPIYDYSDSSDDSELSEANSDLLDDENMILRSPPRDSPDISERCDSSSKSQSDKFIDLSSDEDIVLPTNISGTSEISGPDSTAASTSSDVSSPTSQEPSDKIEELSSDEIEESTLEEMEELPSDEIASLSSSSSNNPSNPTSRVRFSRYKIIRRIPPHNTGRSVSHEQEHDESNSPTRRVYYRRIYSATPEDLARGLGVYQQIREKDFKPSSEIHVVIHLGDESGGEIPFAIRFSDGTIPRL
ncbi:hypothetical protein RUND412_001348 [Rhizina undulata]